MRLKLLSLYRISGKEGRYRVELMLDERVLSTLARISKMEFGAEILSFEDFQVANLLARCSAISDLSECIFGFHRGNSLVFPVDFGDCISLLPGEV